MGINKLITIGMIIGFIVSILGLFFMASCSERSITDCLLEKEYLMPDFYWHTNTIKYVAYNWELPYQVLGYEDGSYDSSSLNNEAEDLKNVIHGPLYYYLGAVIWRISENIGINQILMLHIFSIFLILLTNILFFLLVRKISKYMMYKQQFIFSSVITFIFFPLNLYLSLTIHNHTLFLFFLILSFYLYHRLLEQKSLKNSIFLGISLGLGLLTSSMILPLFLAILFYLLFNYFFNKDKNIKFILFSLFSGFIMGSYTLIRNYLLYGEPIWGGIVAPLRERNFFTLIRVGKAFFSGIYGGNNLIAPLIFIISILIVVISIYGIFCWFREQKKDKFSNAINIILLTGIITLILSFHTVCNLFPLLTRLSCFGDIIHGRHLLAITPALVLFFSIGLVNIFKKYNLFIYLLIIFISILYSLDFISALS